MIVAGERCESDAPPERVRLTESEVQCLHESAHLGTGTLYIAEESALFHTVPFTPTALSNLLYTK